MTQLSPPTPEHEGLARRDTLKARFLDALKEYGTISKASAAAGITRRTASRWQLDDPTFKEAVTQWLHMDQADELHDTLFEIAKMGLTDPKYANAAVKAGELLLKALDRDTYGDQIKQETTITNNQNVTHVIEFRDVMRAEQEAKVRAIRTRTLDMETT